MKKTINSVLRGVRNTLLILIILELILSIVFNFNDKRRYNENVAFKIASGAYVGVDEEIVKEIYEELYYLDTQWNPYTHFKLKKQTTKYNNINAKGHRKTLNRNLKDSTNALKIFCFGGSTMYSTGARDTMSIPSILSKLIYERFPKINVEIINFGCHGYNRSVENIQLQHELLNENIPDIAIFYDGVNEVISGYLNNEAGLPTNAILNKQESKIRFSYKRKVKLLLQSSYTNRLIKFLKNKLFRHKNINHKASKKLSTEIADNYINNLKITKSLSEHFKFNVYNFLQPNIFNKKVLSDPEKIMLKNSYYYEDLYKNSYKSITEHNSIKNDSTFVNISRSFDEEYQTIYTDFCHTGEKGNSIVAKNIMDYLKPVLYEKSKVLE